MAMKILSMPGKSWKNNFMFGILFTADVKTKTKIDSTTTFWWTPEFVSVVLN